MDKFVVASTSEETAINLINKMDEYIDIKEIGRIVHHNGVNHYQ